MSLERIERKSGAVWRVRWRDQGGRERSRVIGRKADAEAFEAEVVRRKRTAGIEVISGSRQTLACFAEEWFELYAKPNLARRTLVSYAALWDRHVLPRLGSYRLGAITTEVVERFRAELEAAGVGAPTVYRALALLQGILRRAVEWRRIAENPVIAAPKPNIRRQREVRPLRPLEVERLRTAALLRRQGQRDAMLISLLAYAGLRPQEVLALTWGDIRERTLLVDKASDGRGGFKSTKTGQARTVRLLAPLARDLAEYRAGADHPAASQLLISTVRENLPWNDGAWQDWHRDAWKPACEETGLDGVRPYDLRHSFVSLLIDEGRSVPDVARQAGHSATMTLDVYSHVFDEQEGAERVSAEDQIERARESVSGLCPPLPEPADETQEIPGNGYSPSCLPKISFMISSVPPPIGPRRASRTARSIPYSRM
jgi:integrase